MLYSEFEKSVNHFIKISNLTNDGWSLKNYKDNVYLVKSLTQTLETPCENSIDLTELNDLKIDLESDDQTVDDPPSEIRKWEYHVLYNLSYQVPVIYFNVWNRSGQLLSLEELWKAINPNFQENLSKNKWFMLTQQEHPYLFKPFFHFHPCHTEDFLKCFLNSNCNMLITWLSSIGQYKMEETGDSLEGFLCPDCLTNFKTALQLTTHYQNKHSDDFLKSVKEIYGKAKKKILFKENASATVEQEENSQKGTLGYSRSEISDEVGAFRNHTELYKFIRTTKMEHYAAQTNNLIIRLEKLLINLPSDPVKRKIHEQDVVPWLNEKDVKLCPGCAKSFNLLRRKHHCRLCGSVMCDECSFLLPLETARKMTNSLITTNSPPENSEATKPEDMTPVKKLLRSPSGVAVQSVLSLDSTSETFFRACEHCYKLLEVRQKLKEVRSQKSILCQFYEKMRTNVEEVNDLLPVYLKMLKSLSTGETTYTLADTEIVWLKILKAADNIDILSNKIAILGQNSENPPAGSQLRLQKAIRNAAMFYLREHIVSLPMLPKEDQIKEAQERRRLEIARRIEEESRLECFENLEPENKSNRPGHSNPSLKSQVGASTSTQKEVLVEDGWTPEIPQTAMGIISDHPIIQQINIIKGYIKQAEIANRMEEVATLQQNLRDLEEEFWRQTKENYVESLPK